MLTIAAGSAILFAVLAALVALGLTASSDLGWTRAFQSVASPPLDVIANAHTVVGQLAVTLPIALVVAFVTRRRSGGRAWVGPLLILATGAVEVVVKTLTAHPAPPQEFVRAFGNPLGVPRELQPPFSFPSGHVARVTFLLFVMAALVARRWAWWVAAAGIALSVFLRVYIGDHWISDALAGVALGVAVGSLAVEWMRRTAARR